MVGTEWGAGKINWAGCCVALLAQENEGGMGEKDKTKKQIKREYWLLREQEQNIVSTFALKLLDSETVCSRQVLSGVSSDSKVQFPITPSCLCQTQEDPRRKGSGGRLQEVLELANAE